MKYNSTYSVIWVFEVQFHNSFKMSCFEKSDDRTRHVSVRVRMRMSANFILKIFLVGIKFKIEKCPFLNKLRKYPSGIALSISEGSYTIKVFIVRRLQNHSSYHNNFVILTDAEKYGAYRCQCVNNYRFIILVLWINWWILIGPVRSQTFVLLRQPVNWTNSWPIKAPVVSLWVGHSISGGWLCTHNVKTLKRLNIDTGNEFILRW